MKRKRIPALLLCLVMVLSLVLTGCGSVSDYVDESTLDDVLGQVSDLLEEEDSEEADSYSYSESSYGESSVSENETSEASGEISEEAPQNGSGTEDETSAELSVQENGEYTSKEEVAAYIHEFGHLPSNYITKNEAKKLGWDSSAGNLWEVAPGKSIGGDKFGNYEGLLPSASGRQYYECDIDYEGGYRDAKRIIFSNDGLVYYTEDHYETFELLYGEE